MSEISVTKGSTTHARYARAKTASKHYQISRSTLWNWVKNRRGFPSPLKAGARVTLFDLNAIDDFIKADTAKTGSAA
jgi:prophage regulatory protein